MGPGVLAWSETVGVRPPEETEPASMEEYERLPEDSLWVDGPGLVEFSDWVGDALAGAEDRTLPSPAE